MGQKYYDKSGKYSKQALKKLFKGKKGKAFQKEVQQLVMERLPLTSAEEYAKGQLGPGGFYESIGPTAQSMRDMVGMTQPILERTAQGQFFDMTPVTQAATRNFAREIGPGYLEGRFAGGADSSGFLEGFGQQARDMSMDLAAMEAEINAGAQRDLALGGGLNQFLGAQATPFGFEGQAIENLLGLGGATRTTEESTRAGAGTLVPTFYDDTFTNLAQIEQNSRIKGGAGGGTQGSSGGGWFV